MNKKTMILGYNAIALSFAIALLMLFSSIISIYLTYFISCLSSIIFLNGCLLITLGMSQDN